MAEVSAPATSVSSQTTSNPENPAQANPKNPPAASEGEGAGVEPWRQVKHKYKAAGEPIEVEYDELLRRASLYDGSEKRLAQATAKEREVLARLDKVKTAQSFDAIVELLGDDERALQLAEDYVWNKIQESKLSPAERDAIAAKKRAEKAEKELADLKQLDEAKNQSQRDSAASEIINREINDAISEAEKAGLSPEDVPEYVERVIENMILHLEYLEECEKEGIEPTKSPLSPRDVLRKLHDRDSKRQTGFVKKLTAKQLKELLSKEQLEELRAADIQELYASTPKPARAKSDKSPEKPVDPFEEKAPAQSRRKPNANDWFKAMDQRYGR